jgi:hypothetical protein
MRAFFKYIIFIFLLVVSILSFLDYSFTKVYENAKPRTKFQYFRSFKNKKIDYIFLGSSRVDNTIMPAIIEGQTGKTAINLGFQATKLGDVYTMLQLIKEYNIQTEKIFIQVDYIFNLENGYSNVMQHELMPFVRENKITKDYFYRHFSNEKQLYYVPFFRYSYFDVKIGLRELLLNVANKETNVLKNKGFTALQGNSFQHGNALPQEINAENKYYNQIVAFARIHKISLVFFCAPFCKHTKNLDFMEKLKNKIPGLYDFSTAVADDKMFQNCSHLNAEGAAYFSKYTIQKMLTDKKS